MLTQHVSIFQRLLTPITMGDKNMTNTTFASMPTLASLDSQPSPLMLVEEIASINDFTPVGIVKEREHC